MGINKGEHDANAYIEPYRPVQDHTNIMNPKTNIDQLPVQ